jgi:hypothetical protein
MYICLVRKTHLEVAEKLNFKTTFHRKERQKVTIKFLLMSPRFKSRTNSNIEYTTLDFTVKEN